MDTKNIEKYLNSFGKYVVKQARTNLTKAKKNVNKDLYNSIKFELDVNDNGFSLDFYMLNYGTFVDKGVSGNKKIQNYVTWDGRNVESPFKYKDRQPPPGILSKWIKQRGIKPKGLGVGRDKNTGRFISNLAFLIGRKIKIDGIKGISFFQKPLGLGMKRFPKEMLEMIKEDIYTTMEKDIKDIKVTITKTS
tara:strand:+ start:2697 stop:3272 length:576 start_codon:yes stop_codon:yes gene_type:complete